MPARDASFDFKMAASELPETARAGLDQMKTQHEQEKQRFDADYAKNRDLYRQQEEKRLAEHYRANHNMKPPPGFDMGVSRERIKVMAADNVQRWYAESREKMVRDARQRERDFVKTALGIQERDRGTPDRLGPERS